MPTGGPLTWGLREGRGSSWTVWPQTCPSPSLFCPGQRGGRPPAGLMNRKLVGPESPMTSGSRFHPFGRGGRAGGSPVQGWRQVLVPAEAVQCSGPGSLTSPCPQAGGPRSSGRASVSSSVKWGNIRTCASCSGVLGPELGRFRPAAVVLGDKALGTKHAGRLCLPALSQLWALTPTPTPTPHVCPAPGRLS